MRATKDRQLEGSPRTVILQGKSDDSALVWPSCSKAWRDIECKLKHNPRDMTMQEQSAVAGLISAYLGLFQLPVTDRMDILTRIKRATKDKEV